MVVYLAMWRGFAEAQVHRMTRDGVLLVPVLMSRASSAGGMNKEAFDERATKPGGNARVIVGD